MQPWEFAILGGVVMENFRERLFENVTNKVPAALEFSPPMKVPEEYDRRRTSHHEIFNNYLYPPGTVDVEAKRDAYFRTGARLFGAPNAIIVYTDRSTLNIPWALESIGIMVQTVCLAAAGYSLGTCVIGRLVDWPDMLREMLDIPPSRVMLTGMVIGYPDTEARVNNFPRERMPVEDWVHWHGF
jgi:nitroreductase